MKVECVLFDLDGVLVNACDWHYDSLNRALDCHGLPLITIEDHVSKYNGLPTKVKLKMLGLDECMIKKINHSKQTYTLETIRKNGNVMPEKIELHKFLKNNSIKIGCVTNSIRETAVEMLKITGQYDYIDLLVSNEDVLKNKPHPECYNLAIQKLRVNPMATICVEDSSKGIEAAMKSLAKHLWVVENTTHVTQHNFTNFIK